MYNMGRAFTLRAMKATEREDWILMIAFIKAVLKGVTKISKSETIVCCAKLFLWRQLQLDDREMTLHHFCNSGRCLGVCHIVGPTRSSVWPLFACSLYPYASQTAVRLAIPCSSPASMQQFACGLALIVQPSSNHRRKQLPWPSHPPVRGEL